MDRPVDGILERALRFFSGEIWRSELRPGSLAAGGMRALQFGVMVVEGFNRHQLPLRASALTYFTVLSVIPILAIGLSLLKALGITENLAELAIAQIPETLPEVREQTLALIQSADLGGLGTIGAVILVGTSVLSLRNVESTLNDIWGVRDSRTWARRFPDYLAVMIVTPLLLAAGLSLATSLRSGAVVEWIETIPALQTFYQFGLQRVPTLLAAIAFTFLYWFFPNTRVQFGSALLGGVVASLLFYMVQHLYVEFSVGAARYSVFFGTFSQLPLLLIWLYLSWSVVLLGAEISFAHQNLAHYRREVQEPPPGAAERESLSLQIALHVARAFQHRNQAPGASELSRRLDTSVRTVNGLLEDLLAAGILSEIGGDDRERSFQLGRPAEDVKVADVLTAIRGERRRREPTAGPHAAVSNSAIPGSAVKSPAIASSVVQASHDSECCDRVVEEELLALDGAVGSLANERSLADLLAELPRGDAMRGGTAQNG